MCSFRPLAYDSPIGTKHTLRIRLRQCARLVPSHLFRALQFDMLPAMEEPAAGLKSCPECAAQMPQSASFCPGCGRSMRGPTEVQATVDPGARSLAAALAYFTFIPALVFLFINRYRQNSLVRFHCLQCLLLWLAAILLGIILWGANSIFFMIPLIGPLIAALVPVLAGLAALVLWPVLMVKAYQGELFKVPGIGLLAERHS